MTRAVVLAALAAGAGVLGAWEAVGAVEGGLGRLANALGRDGPLVRLATGVLEGGETSAAERRRLLLVAAGALLGSGLLIGSALLGLVMAGAAPLVAGALIAAARRRRRGRLADSSPAVARSLADALAAGHSIRGAVVEAARGRLAGPAGAELAAAGVALGLGEATESVLERLRARAHHASYDAIVAAVLLQREAGGDLAGLLRRLAAALEEAARAEADARSLTAQARFTALLVAALPAVAGVLAELARPGYLASLLEHPLTVWLVGCSIGLQALAWAAIRRIAGVGR